MHKLGVLIFRLVLLAILFSCSSALSQYQLTDSKVPIIEKMTASYKDKELSLYDLDKIVKELSQDGLFQVVYIEKLNGNKVVIRAEQSTKIVGINVTGKTSYSEQEIIDKTGIKVGDIMGQLEINQAIDKIKLGYQNSGFYNYKVRVIKTPVKDGTHLTINIDEKDFCLIEEIRIFSKNDNLNKKLAKELLKFNEKNYQQETSGEIEKEIISFLLSNRFLTAKVSNSATIFNKSKTRVKLNFTINNPIQFEFIFHGNNFYSHFDLIKTSQIGGKFLYLSDSSSEIVDSISKLYLQSGFPKFEITFKEQLFRHLNKKVIVFSIDEGPRIRLGKVNIIGKISRDKSYYASLFKEYIAEQAHSVYFVKKDVEAAAESLVNHLRREGHLMAELLSVTIDYTKYNNANINIQIDEGILTYVRQILFRGAKSFSNIQLTEQIGIQLNKPLIIGQVESSFDKLETFYKNHGYLEFKVKNRNASVIQYKPGQPYADIVYQINEGPKIKVKDIKISGADITRHYVLIRELDFEPGDILTLEKVTTSIDRLEKTGLFGKVNITSLEQGSKNNERTIVVEVEERKPGLLSWGVGIQSQGLLTYRGYFGMLYNNLWGKARGISGRADLWYQQEVHYPQNRIALAYYEPFFFKNRVRGRVSLVREQKLSDPTDKTTIRSTNDILLSLDKEFSKHFRLTYNVWGLSNQETFKIKDFQPTQSTNNIATTGTEMELDYRNDLFVPTDGSFYRWDFEFSDPILGSSKEDPTISGFTVDPGNGTITRNDPDNEINYIRTSLSSTFFTPLSKNKRWVWANSVRGGYLTNLSSRDDSGVPRVKSFYLGGSSTLRGFNFGETVPGKRELCIKNNLISTGEATKDCNFEDVLTRNNSAFFLFKSELRFPISGSVGGQIFYDGGAVYIGGLTLEDPYRDSVGVGIRYDTPVGAFVFEAGYKLDRKRSIPGTPGYFDDESEVAIHLSIGTF